MKKVNEEGAYDSFEFRKEVQHKKADSLIPPPRNTILHKSTEAYLEKRNDAILEISRLGGDE